MYNTALRICGEEMMAEDVLQEAFVSAFKNIMKYRGEASFGSWLKRIVINKALNQVKKVKRDFMVLEDIKEEDSYFEGIEPEEPAYSVHQIKEAIKTLPYGFRSVLSLYLFEGYDHHEISEIMGITSSTSKSQYKRAKDKLKMVLKQGMNYG